MAGLHSVLDDGHLYLTNNAAYGGTYIAASIAWLWAVEGQIPTRWDIIGAIFRLTGMAIILVAPMLQK